MSLELASNNHQLNINVLKARPHNIYEFGDFRLDAGAKLLYRKGEQISLTPRAVETLIALVETRGEVVWKDELMHEIWADTIVEESNLNQYLYLLRRTLGAPSDGKPYIETLKRRGYRFNGAVRVVKNENGVSTATEDAENLDGRRNELPKAANLISRRVERRGSVRALNQAAAMREIPHPVTVERSDNVYSVTDWRRSPQADTLLPVVPTTLSKWFSPLVLVVLVAGFAGIGFGIYQFSIASQSAETRDVPFLGSDITRLTTTGRSKHVAISPDGRYVAHIVGGEYGESLWVRQVAVANDTRIATGSQSYFVWVTFAPDGNFVYYLALERDKGEPELFRVPVLGGPIVKVLNDIAPPTFSPDGKMLAFMKQNQEESQLLVANADGTNEVVLVSRREPDYMNMFWYAPAWSLDGKSIAFPVNQSDENGRYETVLAVDVETRVERKLTETRWQQVGQSRWLADGLVVTASETSIGPGQLWHISLPDGAASRITRDLNNYQNLSLTSDSKTLAVIQNHVVSNIWTLGADAAGAKQLRSEAGWLNEMIWLPDGRLAYTSNAGGSSDIWTMNADGSGIRQLTVGANARLGLTVTVDEKQLIFAAERWKVQPLAC